jgi:hypothetical protein
MDNPVMSTDVAPASAPVPDRDNPAPSSALAEALRALALPAMFWRPAWTGTSPEAGAAGLVHVPFFFWLVEAQRPRVVVSLGARDGLFHLAACQAVERLGLDARCLAADPWEDAPGEVPGTAFAAVRAENDYRYPGFAQLLRLPADAAVQFPAPPVDLLHLDLRLAPDADLRVWLPKFADNAVVLAEGVGTTGGTAAASFAELAARHPGFDFVHGEGLALAVLGRRPQPPLRRLIAADPALRQGVREIFARLGRGVADATALPVLAGRAAVLEAEAERLEATGTRAVQAQAAAEAEAAALRAEVAALRTLVQHRDESLTARVSELSNLTVELEHARAAQGLAQAVKAAPDVRYNELLVYARKLERAHAGVLASTAWRMTEPMRGALRRLRGQKPPARFVPRL